MKPKIEKGKALVLVGPQGSGKTTSARELAAAEGVFTEIDVEYLVAPFQTWMDDQIKTVIVEGFPKSPYLMDRSKKLIRGPTMQVSHRGRELVTLPTPNFIFSANNLYLLTLLKDDPEFVVVSMPQLSTIGE